MSELKQNTDELKANVISFFQRSWLCLVNLYGAVVDLVEILIYCFLFAGKWLFKGTENLYKWFREKAGRK